MPNRRPLSCDTVLCVSTELAGNPLDPDRAVLVAGAMEPIMKLMDGLRTVPLKEVEPAVVFRPGCRGADA